MEINNLLTTAKTSFKKYFKIKDSYIIPICGLIISFLVCLGSYSAYIVNGFSSPDGLLEGLHFYINRDWATAGCGRWFLAILNKLHGNMVFPWLIMLECWIVNWLSAHTLCKIFKIEKNGYYFLMCVLFMVLSPFVDIYTYTNSAFSYCISVYFSILFVYVNLYSDKKAIILSALLLGCAMGSYQSQIGIAVGLTLMCIIIKMLNKEDDIKSFTIVSLISAVIGFLVYILGLNISLKVYNLSLYDRAASFSLTGFLSNFVSSFIKMYEVFFSVFNQTVLKRWILYVILFSILAIEVIFIIIDLIKRKEYIRCILFVLLIALLPPALNAIGIILQYQVTMLMTTPNYIIVPFIICLSSYISNKMNIFVNIILGLCVTALSWTYILSANATGDCYRLSYNVYKTQFSNAMDEVYKLDNYKKNQTKIVVIGIPSDKLLRDNMQIYNYSNNLPYNLLYWLNLDLEPSTTSLYILKEFGVDPGFTEYEEYNAIVTSKECVEMPVWPKEGSVQMINGCAVIKFSEGYE